MDSPTDYTLPELADDASTGVAHQHVRKAVIASVVVHLAVIGTLLWLDRAPLTRIDQHITQIALVHDNHADAATAPVAAQEAPVGVVTANAPSDIAPPEDAPTRESAVPVALSTPPPAAAPPTTTPSTPVLAVAKPFAGYDMAMLDTARREYARTLGHYLRNKVRMPDGAARGLEGRAVVTFAVDRSGNVVSARITESSSEPLLDAAALAAVNDNTPLPRPPAVLPFSTIEIDLPVVFPPR